jgi:hypothetical protein
VRETGERNRRDEVDAEAGRICELVSEACALLQRVGEDAGAEAELQHLRRELRVLTACTDDDDVADVACAVVCDIDQALGRHGDGPRYRYRDRAA